jgi:hypothetical protein
VALPIVALPGGTLPDPSVLALAVPQPAGLVARLVTWPLAARPVQAAGGLPAVSLAVILAGPVVAPPRATGSAPTGPRPIPAPLPPAPLPPAAGAGASAAHAGAAGPHHVDARLNTPYAVSTMAALRAPAALAAVSDGSPAAVNRRCRCDRGSR